MLSQEWGQGDLLVSAYSHCLSFPILHHGSNCESQTVFKANYTSIQGKIWHCGDVQWNPYRQIKKLVGACIELMGSLRFHASIPSVYVGAKSFKCVKFRLRVHKLSFSEEIQWNLWITQAITLTRIICYYITITQIITLDTGWCATAAGFLKDQTHWAINFHLHHFLNTKQLWCYSSWQPRGSRCAGESRGCSSAERAHVVPSLQF